MESAAAWICREAGARVTNVFVRDLDLGAPIADAPRLGVVADGLPLHGGRQLATDTTLVSTLKSNGEPRRRTGLCWRLRSVRRRGSIQSWWVHTAVQCWWSLLARSHEGGNHHIPVQVGEGKVPRPATFVATTRRASVEDALVRRSLLRSGPGVRRFSTWSETRGF